MTRPAWPLTVYYDASCPLCHREMHALLARIPVGRVLLVDCSLPTFEEARATAAGVGRDALMSRIHACDAQGAWLRGLDVFGAVYRAAGLPLLATVYESRRLRPALDRAYAWIADHRQQLSRLGLARLFRLIAPGSEQASACASGTCTRPSTLTAATMTSRVHRAPDAPR